MADQLPRTDSTQAMKSIFSAYGEDEEEKEDQREEEEPALAAEAEKTPEENPERMDYVEDNISGSDDEGSTTRSLTPVKVDKRPYEQYKESPLAATDSKKSKLGGRKATRLVSYGPEEEEEDDEDDDADEEEEEVEEQVKKEHDFGLTPPQIETEEEREDHTEHSADVSPAQPISYAEDVQLPPEPPGKCSKSLQEKIRRYHERMLKGADLIANIKAKKNFRNPSIYEKLLEHCEINEKGTNYPPELYDPSIWGPSSYYDELAKAQKIEMDKREKEKKDRTKVEFVTGMKKAGSEGEIKRKTKWDTQPSSGSSSKPPVISAVGTLKKSK